MTPGPANNTMHWTPRWASVRILDDIAAEPVMANVSLHSYAA
jgi:hypothetical protein